MKSNELIRKLAKAGCYMIRQGKGSHQIWYSPITEKEFVVPNHGSQEIGKGLELKIKKVSGI
jgi:predicted RNA binding protein YcfA (HicA-like mRNA interferase family)